jgi:hypothetical protein
MGEFVGAVAEGRGVHRRRGAAALSARPSGAAVEGEDHVLDGPFTESKETLGGYALIEARSEEHALEIAGEFMEIHRRHWPAFEGESEVRLLESEVGDRGSTDHLAGGG